MKDFKHKIVFASHVKQIENEKQKDRIISLASKAENINKLLPKNISLTDNEGFVLFSGESFIANVLNANQDGVGTKEAIELAKGVPFTYLDVNHSRTHLCGVAVASAFTDYSTGKELSEKDVEDMTDPFVVSIVGIVWVAPNPQLADAIKNIKASDSPLKDSVYLSWELAFGNQQLILIDPKKNKFSQGKIIKDEDKIEKLLPKLVSNGGNGLTDDGLKIGRIPVGDVVVLGFGLVENPAAAVTAIEVPEIKSTNNSSDNSNSSTDMNTITENETKEHKDKPKEIDTIEMSKSAYPKPLKRIYKKLQKSKITEAEFSESLVNLINAYSISAGVTGLEYSEDFGSCPTCKVINPEESTRYDNGKIFCGKCGSVSLGSEWTNLNKIKLGKNTEGLYKIIESQINQGNIGNYREIFAEEMCASSPEHKTVKCSCGAIISNCRCSSPNKKIEIINNGCGECKAILDKNENNISQAELTNVIKDNDNINLSMKITKIEELTDSNLKEVKAEDIKQLFASTNQQLVQEGIDKISQEFNKKITEKDTAIKAANESAEKLDKAVKELETKIQEVSANHAKLIEENKQREAVEAFSARMQTIESGFDLDDKQKEIVANKVKTLSNDDEFNKYIAEMEVLLAAKKKKPTKTKPDPDNDGDDDTSKDGDTDKDNAGKNQAKASVQDDKALAEALKNGKADDKNALPNTGATNESLADRAKRTFGIEGWQVVNKRANRI